MTTDTRPQVLADVHDLETYLYETALDGTAFIRDNNDRPWIAGIDSDDATFAISLPQEDENGDVEHKSEYLRPGTRLAYPLIVVATEAETN